MRRHSRSRRDAGAIGLSCPDCGSCDIVCKRDAILVARAVELREGVLLLDAPVACEPFEEAQLICSECDAELADADWSSQRPCRLPPGQQPIDDAGALELLAEKLNEPGDWNGADVCELAADLLRCTGRPIEDEPDDEGIPR